MKFIIVPRSIAIVIQAEDLPRIKKEKIPGTRLTACNRIETRRVAGTVLL